MRHIKETSFTTYSIISILCLDQSLAQKERLSLWGDRDVYFKACSYFLSLFADEILLRY